MYQHILFAADLTDTGKIAAQKAQKLAEMNGAKLSLVHVVEPIPAYGYPGVTAIESPYIDEARKSLAELGQALGLSDADLHLEVGPTKIEILKVAEQLSADLVVIGSHGHHGLSMLLGSTANSVLHSAKCDVLCIWAEH